jgi:hypothetical protein
MRKTFSKHFLSGRLSESQNKERLAMLEINKKRCVECGGHVPAYMNYLCEKCWAEALTEKLKQEDKE